MFAFVSPARLEPRMEDHEGAVDEAEDTDELLCSDMDVKTVKDSDCGQSALRRDQCDLLLDAIDAHLSRLQIHTHGQVNGDRKNKEDIVDSVCLDRSNSESKDTGLGSTVPSTDKATDGSNSDHLSAVTEHVSRVSVEPVGHQEVNKGHAELCAATSWHTGRTGETQDSKSEQCIWRLQRLLGTNTRAGVKDPEAEEEDSICTEDFSKRFKEEMLELQEPTADGADAVSISSDTGLLLETQINQNQNTVQNLSYKSHIRHLAGVPMKSFDTVTIDSDLDSVCTERIWRHLPNTLIGRKAQEVFSLDGSRSRRPENTQQSEKPTFSSDEEGTLGEESDECERCKRAPRTPASTQRREKKQTRRYHSTCSTLSTTSKEKQKGKLRAEFSDLKLSLVGLQQQKSAVMQVVERLREEVEEAEGQQHSLQLSVTQTRTHTQLLRSQLHKLQAQEELCEKEVRALQEGQAALQRHPASCYFSSPNRRMDCSRMSVLERKEMDRLLDSAKSELFSEQRRFRHTLDSMQERLEEVTQELEQREEENRNLREKCSKLEEKLTTAIKHREVLQESVQTEQVAQEGRRGALEKIIAQKELLLLGMQEEKNSLQAELIATREEHSAKLTAVLAQAQKEKEAEVEQLRVQLIHSHKQELQQVKEEEVTRLQESVKQQQDVLRRREEELRREAQEQMKKAVEREQSKFEEQRAKSLREQRRIAEERIKEVERRERAEVERERRSALALQNKVVELLKQVDELESEASVQTARLRALNDEHQAELQTLRNQLQQEAENDTVRLKQCLKQSEKQLRDMKSKLAECERVHQRAAERQEQQSAGWVQDISTECVCLQELLTHNGLMVETKDLSHSATVSEAVQVLQSLRKSLQHLIISLQNRITSLTHTNQQISRDKELELRLQKEQMNIEKERALNLLKEKLIKEHIEELSSMSRGRLCEEGDGVAARLRRQVRAKDEELRQVQRNMAQWKEKTIKRLAQKFEKEFATELERRVSKPKSEQLRRLELLDGELRHLTQSDRDVHLAAASSSNISDLSSTPSNSDKLVRHLQSRIRQLQADSQTHSANPALQNDANEAGDLAGSYLETIAPA